MSARISTAAMVLFLISGTRVFAQESERKWDATGSLGWLFTNQQEFLRLSGDKTYPETSGFVASAQVGRYLSSHLKAEAEISQSTRMETGKQFLPSPERGWNEKQITAQTYSAGLTYQFGANKFMHPFVSTGLSATAAHENQQSYVEKPIPGPNSTCTADCTTNIRTDSSATFLRVRPFVAIGAKSYFNQRTFIRSEGLFAFGPTGVAHVTLRFGFGFDF